MIRNDPNPSEKDVEEAFDGNLCRCTGYRPILDAAQTFSSGNGCAKATANGGSGCCMQQGSGDGVKGCSKSNGVEPVKRFTPPGFIEYHPDTQLIFPPPLTKHELKPLALGNKRKRWYRPVTLRQLMEKKRAYQFAKGIGMQTKRQI